MKRTLLFMGVLAILLPLVAGVLSAQGSQPRNCAVVADIPASDCAGLEALYNAMGGATWENTENGTFPWMIGSTACAWYGITCTNGRVTGIELPSNNLVGELPTALFNLNALTTLNLSTNSVFGTLPAEIGNLTNLQTFSLQGNDLFGTLPTTLGSLTQLRNLNLSFNDFDGTIPTQLNSLAQLRLLVLNDNAFTGSIPNIFGSMPALEGVALNGNALTGSIPTSLGTRPFLLFLTLQGNDLTGTIPAQLGSAFSLETLELGDNQLTGSIPVEIGNLPALSYLDLSQNNLTGTIPPGLLSRSLAVLLLNDNNLSGILPDFTVWTGMFRLDLGNNRFTGTLPANLGVMTNLQNLRLENNLLTGTIPATIGSIPSLTYLNLSNNRLTGVIPDGLGSIVTLQALKLSHNALSGPIPSTIGTSSSLQIFEVNGNQLEGEIPGSLAGMDDFSTPVAFNINYNELTYTVTTPDLTTFLNTYAPGWEATQAVAPTPTSLIYNDAEGSFTLSWTPAGIAANDTLNKIVGFYEVGCGTTPGGPYDAFTGTTLNKSETFLKFYGVPVNTYHCVVRTTITPHVRNFNLLTSGNSPVQTAAVPTFKAPGNTDIAAPAEISGANYQYAIVDTTILTASSTRTPTPELPANCTGGVDLSSVPSLYFRIPAAAGRGSPGHFVMGSVVGSAGSPGHFVMGSNIQLDTIMGIYEHNAGDFTFVACNDNASPATSGSSVIFDRQPNIEYYFVIWIKDVNAASFNFVAGETGLLINNQFEIDGNRNKVPDGWKASAVGVAKINCIIGFANSQKCGVKIAKGARLFQKIRPEVSELWQAGDQIQVAAFIRRKKVMNGTKMRVKVAYDNPSLPTGVLMVKLPTGSSPGFEFHITDSVDNVDGEQPYTLLGSVRKVQIDFRYPGARGHIRVDDVFMDYTPAGGRSTGWIPLPTAP